MVIWKQLGNILKVKFPNHHNVFEGLQSKRLGMAKQPPFQLRGGDIVNVSLKEVATRANDVE